jgi:hypothetical protein
MDEKGTQTEVSPRQGLGRLQKALGASVGKLRAAGEKSPRARLIVVFVLGLVLGVLLKAEASSRTTIGFQDYTLSARDFQAYDVSAMQRELLASGKAAVVPSGIGGGGVCSQ